MYFLPHLYGTIDHMISINIAEIDEFIDFTGAVPSDFTDEFGEFAKTLMNENNMEIPDDDQILSICTYIFWAKLRNAVRLP